MKKIILHTWAVLKFTFRFLITTLKISVIWVLVSLVVKIPDNRIITIFLVILGLIALRVIYKTVIYFKKNIAEWKEC